MSILSKYYKEKVAPVVKQVSNKLTPSAPVQKTVMKVLDPGGLIQSAGTAIGAKDISIQNPLGSKESFANQVVKSAVSPAGVAIGTGGLGGIFGGSQAAGKTEPTPAPEEKGKFSLTAEEQNAALANQDRYSNTAMNEAINRRYEAMGQLAQGQNAAASVGEQNVLKRRLSAMGGLNSGQGLKVLSQQQDAANRRGSDAQLQLQAAQSGELQASNENNQKLNETSRQFDAEYRLNNQIAENNIKMAEAASKANDQGMITSLWTSIFGKNLSSIGGVSRSLGGTK